MAERFIKLYDKILQWEWSRHPNTLCLFIYLLLKANYKDMAFQGKTIKRGQLVTSLPQLATGTGLSIRQTRTALMHLISTGEVTDETTNQYRIITIVKYDQYQNATDKMTGKRQANDMQLDRQTTDESTASIEYIEYIEKDRNIESLSTRERTASRFTKPTKEEIFDFCLEERLNIDVDRFYVYYTSNGWKVGKNPMKDWKATVRNWARKDKDQPASPAQTPSRRVTAQEYTQRDYSNEDKSAFERMLKGVDL